MTRAARTRAGGRDSVSVRCAVFRAHMGSAADRRAPEVPEFSEAQIAARSRASGSSR